MSIICRVCSKRAKIKVESLNGDQILYAVCKTSGCENENQFAPIGSESFDLLYTEW